MLSADSRRRRRRRGELVSRAKFSGYTMPANSGEDTLVGSMLNKIATTTLTLPDNAGGRFKLNGLDIVAGAVASAAGTYLVTLKESKEGMLQNTQVVIIVT